MNWNDYFIYDETSPSGLSSKRSGKHVGWFYKRGEHKYPLWAVKVGHTSFSASRIVYSLYHNIQLESYHYIDHIDRNSANNKIENLRLVSPALNSRNKSKRTITEVTGVTIERKTSHPRWRALWMEDGRQRSKSFSVKKYGFEKAKELAIQYRKEQIERLNSLGYGYTETHGL